MELSGGCGEAWRPSGRSITRAQENSCECAQTSRTPLLKLWRLKRVFLTLTVSTALPADPFPFAPLSHKEKYAWGRGNQDSLGMLVKVPLLKDNSNTIPPPTHEFDPFNQLSFLSSLSFVPQMVMWGRAANSCAAHSTPPSGRTGQTFTTNQKNSGWDVCPLLLLSDCGQP